jgi:hypothetical protein
VQNVVIILLIPLIWLAVTALAVAACLVASGADAQRAGDRRTYAAQAS